jgi:hypothetical protein
MTQKDKLIKDIADKLNSMCDKILAYKKVDATLSEKTLFETAIYLNMAESKLESGFVNDACNEVEKLMSYN